MVVIDTGGNGRGETQERPGEGGINTHDIRLWVWQVGQKRVSDGARETDWEVESDTRYE